MNVRIAIQSKGRLNKPSIKFLESLGLELPENGRKLINKCKKSGIEVLYSRSSDIPEYVSRGVADFGIVGQNVLIEKESDVKQIKPLGFGACKLVLAVPEGSKIKSIQDLEGERIATSYPNTLKKYLRKNKINAAVIKISGSVEAAPKLNLADAICDITQTGSTLKENHLIILDAVLESQAVLISGNGSSKEALQFIKEMNSKEMEEIRAAFDGLPADKILKEALDVQKQLKKDQTLARQEKASDEWGWVTKADENIQRMILDYFAKSALAGKYSISAEEKISKKEPTYYDTRPIYKLVVDPLDGTSSFIKQQETWGVMIGLCDSFGLLKYSWCMVADGSVYKTSDISEKRPGFAEAVKSGSKINIDVYDYKSGASEKFGQIFENLTGYTTKQYAQTSYPAAVWVGWELFRRNLDGMLWVSSNKGKKFYPDYDLVFLGVLHSLGFKIRLGKLDDKNAIVAVGFTDEDADLLYKTGLKLISADQQQSIRLSENLIISSR